MSAVSVLKQNERMLAALAPLLAAAGALVYPAASTLLPFVLFLFLRGRDLPLARDAALRTADLAFSVYLALTVIGLGISALWAMETTAALVPAGALPDGQRSADGARKIGCFYRTVARARLGINRSTAGGVRRTVRSRPVHPRRRCRHAALWLESPGRSAERPP